MDFLNMTSYLLILKMPRSLFVYNPTLVNYFILPANVFFQEINQQLHLPLMPQVVLQLLEMISQLCIHHQKEEYSQGDLVTIPHDLPFTYKGKCKLLRITTPAFTPEQEETLPVHSLPHPTHF